MKPNRIKQAVENALYYWENSGKMAGVELSFQMTGESVKLKPTESTETTPYNEVQWSGMVQLIGSNKM